MDPFLKNSNVLYFLEMPTTTTETPADGNIYGNPNADGMMEQ